jgi:hypothetical protein
MKRGRLKRNKTVTDSEDTEIDIPPSRLPGIVPSEDRDTDEDGRIEDSSPEDRRHSDWEPETRYLRCKVFREIDNSLGSPTDMRCGRDLLEPSYPRILTRLVLVLPFQ